jgi:hypothetical protein
MDTILLALEAELVQRLNPISSDLVRVVATPEDVNEIKTPRGSRVMVAFSGETFQPPANTVNQSAPIIQPYDIRFTVILQLRNLRSHQGALPLIEQIRHLLIGFCPQITGKPIYQTSTEFVSNEDSLWTFTMTLIAPAVYTTRPAR